VTARTQVVAAARGWLGTPWRHQGRSRHGVDCGGLLVQVARELGLADVDVTAYPMEADGASLRALCEAHMARIPLAEAAPGDAVLIRFRPPGPESHLALVTDYPGGRLALLHALNRGADGRVVEHRLDAHWRSLIVAAYRLPGVH
jgi:cell wall-associated NlpC family hydrolase